MPVEIEKEWIVVDWDDKILYRADGKADAVAWQDENDRGEVCAVPERPTGGVF